MRIIFMLVMALSVGTLTAQNGLKFERTASVQAFDQSSFFSKVENKIDGSIYLNNDWNSDGIVYTNDGQKLLLNNINFNIKEDVFQSKISEDSIFTFRLINLDKVLLNRKIYKNMYVNGKNKIYEVIYESDKISVYKAYNIELLAASNDPMVGRSSDKFVQKSSYYFMKSNDFRSFRLSKKGVLKLFDDKVLVGKIQTFVKNNKLSYKKEHDISKIMNFAIQNSL